ncbi:2,4-dihydroxyhept-2-ene-1,7-dioic acid aldolase [Aspergillus steynii IBT 23096]|uniref:2,4-dihydroxyhept-2-ene-1,7-dioic acid aldolase n=1 Tax=Aspergillus steynii IBT 23096 TaxID=1392250 RepID=A0A2I2GPV2_9EURO|nr:2,4-dihydroxyhept-2-ene-1,7-dioic acid aldolase [Aspergillus steynii IBT 23096]PLB54901.1 2,4-dihydroxyhept-2-ene-1,7-dioic acid aldolase [Aspergillus steynii IBT 23096]
MQAANRLQKALKAGNPAYGAWQMLPGTNLTRTICRSAPNIDWLLVDLEHGNISDDAMHEIVAASAACGVSPIVRVMEGGRSMIKRALDSGAHGILVPVIETVEDAKKVVEYSKFPPLGKRGFEPLLAVEKFVEQHPHGGRVRQLTGMEYLRQADSSLVIAVQIERQGALDNVSEIAAIPGIDVLFIGPFDLGMNIGHPIDDSGAYDQELLDAIEMVHAAAKSAGKSCGIYCDTGEEGGEYSKKGFQMISVMTDMIGIRKAFGQAFSATLDRQGV